MSWFILVYLSIFWHFAESVSQYFSASVSEDVLAYLDHNFPFKCLHLISVGRGRRGQGGFDLKAEEVRQWEACEDEPIHWEVGLYIIHILISLKSDEVGQWEASEEEPIHWEVSLYIHIIGVSRGFHGPEKDAFARVRKVQWTGEYCAFWSNGGWLTHRLWVTATNFLPFLPLTCWSSR